MVPECVYFAEADEVKALECVVKCKERAEKDWENLKAGIGNAQGSGPLPRVSDAMPPLNGPPPPLRAESDDETEDTAAEAGHLRSAPDELGRRIDTKRMSSLHLQRALHTLEQCPS